MLGNKKKKKGFTLIELIIVIAIIAILAAIAIPKFGDIRRNAAIKSDVANAKVIANATSALIADGEIEILSQIQKISISPQEVSNYDEGGETSTPTVDSSGSNNEEALKKSTETLIKEYLQNVPSPESAGYDVFIVYIDDSGNVNVTMYGTDVDELNLYPGEVKKVEQSKI